MNPYDTITRYDVEAVNFGGIERWVMMVQGRHLLHADLGARINLAHDPARRDPYKDVAQSTPIIGLEFSQSRALIRFRDPDPLLFVGVDDWIEFIIDPPVSPGYQLRGVGT